MSQAESAAVSDVDASADSGPPKLVPIDAASGENAVYISDLFDQYTADPESVPADWQAFFAGFTLGTGGSGTAPASGTPSNPGTRAPTATQDEKPVGVYDLVHSYREYGHYQAHLDPLTPRDKPRDPHPMLSLDNFGLADVALSDKVGLGGFLGHTDGTLGDLIDKLRQTYCGTVGIELAGVADRDQRSWLQQQIEPGYNEPDLTADQQKDVHRQLVAAEEFEQFLHKAFVGSKRFSLEGGESLVPLLNAIVEGAGALNGEQVICAMAHRGRLNVLAHVLEKPLETIIAEFAGTITRKGTSADYGDGDVKYHLGYAKSRTLCPDGGDGCEVKVSLLPNPSHLELINPIQQGIIRCKQQWMLDGNRSKVVPVCLHGDAAFCGQGIVFETLNLSELIGYRTGGTIHVIVNNQVGFTTPPRQGRFTPYPTDVAKAIAAPVFHVNGDDPEAVYRMARLAVAFRQKFKQDVLIDLWCYRKYGHNEADEPAFTQPLMYKAIAKHPGVRKQYEQELIAAGGHRRGQGQSVVRADRRGSQGSA